MLSMTESFMFSMQRGPEELLHGEISPGFHKLLMILCTVEVQSSWGEHHSKVTPEFVDTVFLFFRLLNVC